MSAWNSSACIKSWDRICDLSYLASPRFGKLGVIAPNTSKKLMEDLRRFNFVAARDDRIIVVDGFVAPTHEDNPVAVVRHRCNP